MVLGNKRRQAGSGLESVLGEVKTVLFCVSYWGELLSLAAVSQMLPGKEKLVFLDRSFTASEQFENDVQAVCDHFGIRIVGIKSAQDVERGRGLWKWLRSGYAQQQKIDSLLAHAIPNESGERVVVAYAHPSQPYVANVLSAISRKQRIYYPHGIDQPRKEQNRSHLIMQPRKWRSLPVAVRARPGWRWIIAQKIYYRLHARRAYRFPLLGADYGFTFSKHSLPYPYERVHPDVLQKVIDETLTIPSIKEKLEALALPGNLNDACVVLLMEVGQSKREVNVHFVAAYAELIRQVVKKTAVRRIYLKPHPRNSQHWVESVSHELGVQLSDLPIRVLSSTGAFYPIELLTQRFAFRCMASIASCSNSSYIANRVPHYVTPAAAKLIDTGWLVPYSVNFVEAQKVLVEEHLAEYL